MGFHVALHWNWIVNTVKRLFMRGEVKSRPTAAFGQKDAQA
jgi:hypothetical protein